jgi:hypothetical protein
LIAELGARLAALEQRDAPPLEEPVPDHLGSYRENTE